ncbi:ribonuclease HIII [Candidatus Gracilibacteria bacterium]|nr:ribonuclease HIII [Candidatus Gracilibacteria bacterium]
MSTSDLAELYTFINAQGWSYRTGKPVPYGEQVLISAGAQTATLNYYPKRGRFVVGGTDTVLRRRIERWIAERSEVPAADLGRIALETAQIGLDESGKGDWFGPLVVAAVYVEPSQAAALTAAGVRDSKTVGAQTLPRIAEAIERLVPAQRRFVLALMPEAYNQRYAAYNNINLLLATLYSEAALPIWQTTQSTAIVCDQFSQRADRLDSAFASAGMPKPTQYHHAESRSIAVAAASILASTRFGAELQVLGRKAGLNGALPRGASAIYELQHAARTIIAHEGREGLARYAKLNFKPVQALLETG